MNYLESTLIPKDYINNLLTSPDVITKTIQDDMKIGKLTDLSLQQAVDLARLLMRIEMDFQKYTENVPTVGGVIKIATIDEKGFKFIKGSDVIVAENT